MYTASLRNPRCCHSKINAKVFTRKVENNYSVIILQSCCIPDRSAVNYHVLHVLAFSTSAQYCRYTMSPRKIRVLEILCENNSPPTAYWRWKKIIINKKKRRGSCTALHKGIYFIDVFDVSQSRVIFHGPKSPRRPHLTPSSIVLHTYIYSRYTHTRFRDSYFFHSK